MVCRANCRRRRDAISIATRVRETGSSCRADPRNGRSPTLTIDPAKALQRALENAAKAKIKSLMDRIIR